LLRVLRRASTLVAAAEAAAAWASALVAAALAVPAWVSAVVARADAVSIRTLSAAPATESA
jgi:hypothetical protein